MNLVEKEALKFKTRLFQNSQSLQIAKSTLIERLIVFNREKDKLYFLNVIRQQLYDQKVDHEKTCQTVNCGTSQNLDNALFVIDQEIEDINKYYEPNVAKEDEFSVDLRVEIHSRINEVLEKLQKLEYGQEVVYNEIDELKEHFNLGKKKWLQLLKGKLIELGLNYAVEKVVLDNVYDSLVKGIEDSATSFIDLL